VRPLGHRLRPVEPSSRRVGIPRRDVPHPAFARLLSPRSSSRSPASARGARLRIGTPACGAERTALTPAADLRRHETLRMRLGASKFRAHDSYQVKQASSVPAYTNRLDRCGSLASAPRTVLMNGNKDRARRASCVPPRRSASTLGSPPEFSRCLRETPEIRRCRPLGSGETLPALRRDSGFPTPPGHS